MQAQREAFLCFSQVPGSQSSSRIWKRLKRHDKFNTEFQTESWCLFEKDQWVVVKLEWCLSALTNTSLDGWWRAKETSVWTNIRRCWGDEALVSTQSKMILGKKKKFFSNCAGSLWLFQNFFNYFNQALSGYHTFLDWRQALMHRPVIPVNRRLRQENGEFQTSLGYIVNLCLKNKGQRLFWSV